VAILTPLHTGTAIRQAEAYLGVLRATTGRIEADFRSTKTEDLVVRITCDGVIQVRQTDEMIFSTSDEAWEGNNPAGFAYVVEGGRMLDQLPEHAQQVFRGRLKHYLILSLEDGLEFVSHEPPKFEPISA
jgi:hypothetical protein